VRQGATEPMLTTAVSHDSRVAVGLKDRREVTSRCTGGVMPPTEMRPCAPTRRRHRDVALSVIEACLALVVIALHPLPEKLPGETLSGVSVVGFFVNLRDLRVPEPGPTHGAGDVAAWTSGRFAAKIFRKIGARARGVSTGFAARRWWVDSKSHPALLPVDVRRRCPTGPLPSKCLCDFEANISCASLRGKDGAVFSTRPDTRVAAWLPTRARLG
jgi:hypothetical protein